MNAPANDDPAVVVTEKDFCVPESVPQDTLPIGQEDLETVRSQIRFAAERYSFRGTNGSIPSEYVRQIPGAYPFPVEDQYGIRGVPVTLQDVPATPEYVLPEDILTSLPP